MVTIYKPFKQAMATNLTVAIDIGHGKNTFPPSKGVYVGGVGYHEHDFNSRLAVEVDRLLKAIGFKTIMYQKPFSAEVDLNQRINYYNRIKPDLVWSIHANANSNKEVEGCCAFYWHSNSKMKKLAQEYGKLAREAGYHTHGDGTHASTLNSWTNLAITRATTSDAVLTENGFMTNDEPGINDDFELLFGSKKDAYVREMARIHAKAICSHFSVPYKEESTAEQVSKPTAPAKPAAPEKPSAPAPKPAKTESIVDYLNAKGQDSSIDARKKLAPQYGISGYEGTAEQNTLLLDRIRSGWKPAPKPATKNYWQKGDTGSAIGTIQKNLNKTGAKLAVDNSFGPAVERAVKAFQKKYGLTQDGSYGPATQAKMKQVLADLTKPAAKPKKEYVQLPGSATSWRLYPVSKSPVKGNEMATLNPAKFDGLEYAVLARPQANIVTIKTSQFGIGNIYVAASTGAKIIKK